MNKGYSPPYHTPSALKGGKIEFRSLSDRIDTTTTMKRFTFHLLGAIAEMERDLIQERINDFPHSPRSKKGPSRL